MAKRPFQIILGEFHSQAEGKRTCLHLCYNSNLLETKYVNYYLISCNIVLLEILVLRWLRNSSPEPEGSLLYSEESANGPYTKPVESSPHPHTILLYKSS
jgi:hypothetical protein